MPVPLVNKKERKRRKDGVWRKKRSDAGKSRTTYKFEFIPEWIVKENDKLIYGYTILEEEKLIVYEVYDRSKQNEIINYFIDFGRNCDVYIVDVNEIRNSDITKSIMVTDKISGHKIALRFNI